MTSAVVIIGFVSITAVLSAACYILRKLGAEELAYFLAGAVAFGFLAALAGAALL